MIITYGQNVIQVEKPKKFIQRRFFIGAVNKTKRRIKKLYINKNVSIKDFYKELCYTMGLEPDIQAANSLTFCRKATISIQF